jgi:hypothetical protein
MNEVKQGDKVTFDLSEKVVNLTGKVCGKLGPVVIVELDTALNGYPFTHIYIVDSQIKP